MGTFLRQVARALLAEHGDGLRQVAVVLPSQRAGLYLRKELAAEAGKALWSPQVFTLATFMEQLSGLRPLPPEELLFEGYEAYREAEGPRARPFSDFIQWAGTTLGDISEADAHLVKLDSYYRDLRSWEDIPWTFRNDPLSQGQERMVHFWAMVGRMHQALNARLLRQGAGTSGLIERTAAENPGPGAASWSAVWFAGLNAFTPAQKRVLGRFASKGLARMAWDADHYYLDRPEQEAGLHLRMATEAFGPGMVPVGNRLLEGALQLRTLAAPNEAAQAWCAAELLALAPPAEREGTAVVLADESLLQPLLEALPQDLGPVNITMGLVLARTPVGAYLEALHRLHAGKKPGAGFFHLDVDRFLTHSLLRQGPWAEAFKQAAAGLRDLQRAFIGDAAIREVLGRQGLAALADGVFAEVGDVRTGMPPITVQALSWAKQATANDHFATEQVYQASLAMERMHRLFAQYDHDLDLKAYAALFKRLMGAARIGLFGEPLAGVQIMGLLEARALDPERLIVLGAQEGTLPASDASRSFIPFELRRHHHMPLRDGNDAVQAYNFLRLLQRAKQAAVIWPEGEAAAGPSRFILQLRHELFPETRRPLPEGHAKVRMPQPGNARISIIKDPPLLRALHEKLEIGLSPSAIGDWLRCPLDFHFKHVLRLRESDPPDVRIPENILGEALHNTLEVLYRPWVGRPVNAQDLDSAASNARRVLEEELDRHLSPGQKDRGQPLLQLNMAAQAIQRFLQREADTARRGGQLIPLHLEVEMRHPLELAAHAIGSPVFLKGRADRVDRWQDQVRILDLKSGKVDPADLSIRDLSLEELQRGNKRYAAQLLIYAWLYLREHPGEASVQAGILALRQAASSDPLFISIAGRTVIGRADLPAIEDLFTAMVRAMTDPGLPVEHDPRSKYCTFCLADD